MRDLNYDVDRALGIPARRPAALLSAAVDEVLGQPLESPEMEMLRRVLEELQVLRNEVRRLQHSTEQVAVSAYGPLVC